METKNQSRQINANDNHSPVILIVEDSQPMRIALADLMDLSYPSSTILQAENAEQALELAASQPPDLVLMDIVLPGMDGLTCLKEIRKISPQTKSVVISYHEDQPYQKKAQQAGASAFVAKRRIYLDLMRAVDTILKIESSDFFPGSAEE